MKINNFEVECELEVADAETLTGWFEVPSLPHTRYTIEINVGLLVGEALHAQKLAHYVELGEICGTCGVSKDQFPRCEIEGCEEIVKLAAAAESQILESTQEERDELNAEIAAGGDPEADHEKAAEVPNTDGTASDDDAPAAETEKVLMPDGDIEPVLPADVAGSDDHAAQDAEP